MEKINLPSIYRLGAQLNPLTKVTYDAHKRIEVLVGVLEVLLSMEFLFKKFPSLAACRAKVSELESAKDEARNWLREVDASKVYEPDEGVDHKFERLITMAKEFEIVLSAELQTLAAYHITQKGIYSTTDLVERAEGILPQHVLGRIGQMAVGEVRESGKCLALDCATASAFHMMRATEEVMYRYYVSVCKPKPARKLENWGAYIAELSKSSQPEVKEVVAMLQQIKDRHRNLIMHPEIVLTIDEAFTLFEIAQGAIIAMADNITVRGKKKGK
jgi:hypothetical protein